MIEKTIVELNDSDDQMSAWAKPQLEQIAKYIEDSSSMMLKIDSKVELEQCNDQGICCLWLEGRSISIEPERLGSPERYGWTVTTYRTTNNYPHSPDDVEDVRYGESFSTLGISQIAMNAVWDLISYLKESHGFTKRMKQKKMFNERLSICELEMPAPEFDKFI